MRVDVAQQVLDFKGKPATDQEGEPVLISNLIFQALNTPTQADVRDDEHAYRRYRITESVMGEPDGDGCRWVNLAQKDVTFIIEASGKVNPPLAHGRLRDVLDPPADDALPDLETVESDAEVPSE